MVTLNQFAGKFTVPANLQANANKTVSILNEIFAKFPGRFRFTSGYRSPAHNAAVGGVPTSYHIQALAGDFVPNNGVYFQSEINGVNAIAAKYGYEVLIHNAGSGKHYHIEPLPQKKNESFQAIAGVNETKGNNTVYLIGGLLVLYLLTS
jgi:hypothetical protein